jgi:dihydroanticapsin dehydrogenase
MRAAVPAMLARGGGSIITTSSVEAFYGEPLAAPYTTAKAAVIGLTKTVAREYGRRNIRANCICPGAVTTPLLERFESMVPGYVDGVAAAHATGRCIRPDEIANVVLFLASEESSAITGAAIVADAGLTCALKAPSFPPFGT